MARNYAAEYQRRVARGLEHGLSRSQARGHPRPGQAHRSAHASIPAYDRRLESGLKALRSGDTLADAARSVHVSPERLRAYVVQTGVVEKRRGHWTVVQDDRPRDLSLFTAGQALTITVPGYMPAALVGRYMAAVGVFLTSNDPANLTPFVGESVTDSTGIRHVFETRLNVLYRLAAGGGASFEQVYRIVA